MAPPSSKRDQFVVVVVVEENCPTFPMNTTRTAQYLWRAYSAASFGHLELENGTYAAAEARISCLLARVKRDITAENTSVKSSSTAIMIATVLPDWTTRVKCHRR
jgi:hypothetical protein